MFVTYGIGGVIGNALVAATDGRSRRSVTAGGAAVLAAGLLILAAAFDGWMLLAGTGVIAIGATGMVCGGEIAIANALAVAGRSDLLERMLARGNLGAVVGDVTVPLAVAGLRVAGVDWRVVFTAAAVCVVAYAAALAVTEFPPPIRAADHEQQTDTIPIRRQRLIWMVGLGAFAAMPLDEPYLSTVLAFAERRLDYSSAEAAALGAAFVIGGVIAFTVLPPLVARTPLGRLLSVGGLALTAVMALAAIGPGWLLAPIGVVHSTLLCTIWLGEQSLVLRANPGREGRTRLLVECFEGGAFVLVYGIGVIARYSGLAAAMWVYAAIPLLLVVVGFSIGRFTQCSRDN
jgi:hypothetical protein